MHYSYESDSDISSVGVGPYNFVIRKNPCSMGYIASAIHAILISNRKQFNLNGVDVIQQYNLCTVIIYYTAKDLTDKPLLGMQSDCVYYVTGGNYMDHSTSQAENNLVVVYSLGDSRVLDWKS